MLSLSLLVFVFLLWLCFPRESREAFSFRAPFSLDGSSGLGTRPSIQGLFSLHVKIL